MDEAAALYLNPDELTTRDKEIVLQMAIEEKLVVDKDLQNNWAELIFRTRVSKLLKRRPNEEYSVLHDERAIAHYDLVGRDEATAVRNVKQLLYGPEIPHDDPEVLSATETLFHKRLPIDRIGTQNALELLQELRLTADPYLAPYSCNDLAKLRDALRDLVQRFVGARKSWDAWLKQRPPSVPNATNNELMRMYGAMRTQLGAVDEQVVNPASVGRQKYLADLAKLCDIERTSALPPTEPACIAQLAMDVLPYHSPECFPLLYESTMIQDPSVVDVRITDIPGLTFRELGLASGPNCLYNTEVVRSAASSAPHHTLEGGFRRLQSVKDGRSGARLEDILQEHKLLVIRPQSNGVAQFVIDLTTRRVITNDKLPQLPYKDKASPRVYLRQSSFIECFTSTDSLPKPFKRFVLEYSSGSASLHPTPDLSQLKDTNQSARLLADMIAELQQSTTSRGENMSLSKARAIYCADMLAKRTVMVGGKSFAGVSQRHFENLMGDIEMFETKSIFARLISPTDRTLVPAALITIPQAELLKMLLSLTKVPNVWVSVEPTNILSVLDLINSLLSASALVVLVMRVSDKISPTDMQIIMQKSRRGGLRPILLAHDYLLDVLRLIGQHDLYRSSALETSSQQTCSPFSSTSHVGTVLRSVDKIAATGLDQRSILALRAQMQVRRHWTAALTEIRRNPNRPPLLLLIAPNASVINVDIWPHLHDLHTAPNSSLWLHDAQPFDLDFLHHPIDEKYTQLAVVYANLLSVSDKHTLLSRFKNVIFVVMQPSTDDLELEARFGEATKIYCDFSQPLDKLRVARVSGVSHLTDADFAGLGAGVDLSSEVFKPSTPALPENPVSNQSGETASTAKPVDALPVSTAVQASLATHTSGTSNTDSPSVMAHSQSGSVPPVTQANSVPGIAPTLAAPLSQSVSQTPPQALPVATSLTPPSSTQTATDATPARTGAETEPIAALMQRKPAFMSAAAYFIGLGNNGQ